MTKKEIIWREILHQTLENKKIEWSQKELAGSFGFSLSTVFQALQVPRRSGAISVSGRGFRVEDAEKFLTIWATFRNLKKDVIYETHIPKGVKEIEGEMPPEVIFGCFSAYVRKYKEAPADYDKIYVYINEKNLHEIQNRFPKQKGYPNLVVLEADPWLEKFGNLAPDVQTFVDLWNIPEWYAKDYLNAIKEKLNFYRHG